jgi:hypothetical protein
MLEPRCTQSASKVRSGDSTPKLQEPPSRTLISYRESWKSLSTFVALVGLIWENTCHYALLLGTHTSQSAPLPTHVLGSAVQHTLSLQSRCQGNSVLYVSIIVRGPGQEVWARVAKVLKSSGSVPAVSGRACSKVVTWTITGDAS